MPAGKRDAQRRLCLFTGISGTLGRDFAARYHDDYDIVGVYHRNRPAIASAPISRRLPDGGIHAIRCDLAAVDAVEELATKVLDRFGSVDLVVNAAVSRRFAGTTDPRLLDNLDWDFFVNVTAAVRLVGAITRQSWRDTPAQNIARHRNVVHLSSTAGHVVYPRSGQGGYSATKAALDMLTVHAAEELAQIGVRVNAVAPDTFPGIVATESVSDAIVDFDRRRKRTGQILVIDRGGSRLLRSRVAGH